MARYVIRRILWGMEGLGARPPDKRAGGGAAVVLVTPGPTTESRWPAGA